MQSKPRTQKKVLSLVLCVAMMLSVMVMSTGAAFSDEDEFSPQYKEAAEVLTNLKVMQGYENGSYFLPQRNITRAQVATLIYRAATGDVTDSQTDIYSDYDKFDDVQSTDWFAGYVNYCGNAELIKGFTPTTFGPNKNVTGYQVLAMILRAVGYDQNDEFTGPGWEVRTASTAESLGILDNVQDATLGQPATRELVAELIFRAMIVPTVEYTPAFGYQQERTTLGWNEFKLFQEEGTIVANQMADLREADTSLADGKTAIRNNFNRDNTYNLTTDTSIIGEKVNVWIADETAVSTPVSLADVTDWSNTVLDKDQIQEIKDATDRGTAVYNNYVKDTKYDSGLGTMVKAIDNNGDGDYEYILTEKETLAAVKYVNTDGKVTLDTMKSENTQVTYDGIAVGDVVLVNTFGGKTYIEAADYVTGNISAYQYANSATDTATINGSDYMVSDIDYVSNSVTTQFKTVRDTFAQEYNGRTYNYFQDAYGNIRAYNLASQNETQYGLVLAIDYYKTGAFAGEQYVRYLTVNNTVETSLVADNTSVNLFDVGDVVQYRLNSDNEFVNVYPIDSDKTGYIDTDATAMKATLDGTTYNVTSDFIAFYYEPSWAPGFGAIYGVLTGEDAINDVDGKYVTQIDTIDSNTVHTDRYATMTVANVSDIIDWDTQYCYIFTDKSYGEYTTADGTLYTYDAVNAAGDPIKVVVNENQRDLLYKSEFPIWNYVTSNIDVMDSFGNTQTVSVNLVTRVTEYVLPGDLHADQTSSNVFRFYGVEDPDGMQLKAPAVYADVTSTSGGTVDLSATYCSAGYVVYDTIDGTPTALAAFVEQAVNDEPKFVDVTINGTNANDTYHLLVGAQFPVDDSYAGGTYSWTAVDGTSMKEAVNANNTITIVANMEGKTVTLAEAPVPNSALGKLDSVNFNGELQAVSPTGYEKLSDAVDNAIGIDLPNTTPYAMSITTKTNDQGYNLQAAIQYAGGSESAKALNFDGKWANISGVAQPLAGLSNDGYIVISLENYGDVVYYAYHITDEQ